MCKSRAALAVWVGKEWDDSALPAFSLVAVSFLVCSFASLSEVVTRLSPLCCENMAESGAVSTIFAVIRSCNRSVPCMDVVGCAVQVLLNVAKVLFHFNNKTFTRSSGHAVSGEDKI